MRLTLVVPCGEEVVDGVDVHHGAAVGAGRLRSGEWRSHRQQQHSGCTDVRQLHRCLVVHDLRQPARRTAVLACRPKNKERNWGTACATLRRWPVSVVGPPESEGAEYHSCDFICALHHRLRCWRACCALHGIACAPDDLLGRTMRLLPPIQHAARHRHGIPDVSAHLWTMQAGAAR